MGRGASIRSGVFRSDLLTCTKAREWSNQRRSKDAFSTLLSALEAVGPMRRAPSRACSCRSSRKDQIP